MSDDLTRIGLVDGSVDSNSRTFYVVLDAATVIQLDELVAVSTELPDGRVVTHYGIVTELLSRFEGADLPSDTGRVIDRTLPAELVRRAEVRVLRVVPELFLAPHAGAVVGRAAGPHRTVALFEDEMTRGKLPLGLDLSGMPVYADMRFVDGRSGGHVSISGISGVATKTSYALFLLYQLLETEGGMDLLGGRANRENVRALVFNTKGEDLLHLDRPNREFADKPQHHEQWRALGVPDPGPFRSVRLYAPRGAGTEGNLTPLVQSRATGDVDPYGWTPEQFIRDQLLQFCFTSEDERATQVGFVEQQVRIQLLRRLRRPAGDDSGAVVIADQVAPQHRLQPRPPGGPGTGRDSDRGRPPDPRVRGPDRPAGGDRRGRQRAAPERVVRAHPGRHPAGVPAPAAAPAPPPRAADRLRPGAAVAGQRAAARGGHLAPARRRAALRGGRPARPHLG